MVVQQQQEAAPVEAALVQQVQQIVEAEAEVAQVAAPAALELLLFVI
jgi:hypothetical protein